MTRPQYNNPKDTGPKKEITLFSNELTHIYILLWELSQGDQNTTPYKDALGFDHKVTRKKGKDVAVRIFI